MCQLTFCYSNDSDFIKKYIFIQSIINSQGRHDDGFGMFYNNKKIMKTKLAANDITNFGKLLKAITHNKIISHCRDASYNVPVEDKYSHPFESEHFILAHNGQLKEKAHITIVNKSLSDSENFLSLMEKNYTIEKDFVKLVNKTMLDFTGSFAFLIYSKPEKKYYAIRGKTKPLHYVKAKIGEDEVYMINTELDSLKYCLQTVNNLYEINGISIKILEEPKLLDKEKIYLLDNDIKEIGDIKENEAYVVPGVFQSTGYVNNAIVHSSYVNRGINAEEIKKGISIINEIGGKYSITLRDIDILLYALFNTTKLTCEIKDIIKLKEKLNLVSSVSDSTLKVVGNFVDEFGYIVSDDYNDFNFQYPYFVNNDEEVIEFISLLKADRKSKDKKK